MKPLPPSTIEAQKAEEQRQVQMLSDAISSAIMQTGETCAALGSAPQLNALIGALASQTARALSAIDKPAHRRMMRQAFDRAVVAAMKDERNVSSPKAEVFVCRPKSQLS